MKVSACLMLGLYTGQPFTVRCTGYHKTGKSFLGIPIYELEGVDFSTLSIDGLADGVIIEVEEIV